MDVLPRKALWPPIFVKKQPCHPTAWQMCPEEHELITANRRSIYAQVPHLAIGPEVGRKHAALCVGRGVWKLWIMMKQPSEHFMGVEVQPAFLILHFKADEVRSVSGLEQKITPTLDLRTQASHSTSVLHFCMWLESRLHSDWALVTLVLLSWYYFETSYSDVL